MKFSDIPGHEEEKRRLRELVDTGRVPHALLLEGPSGSGKFALARAYVQYLHCQNRENGDSCGHCPACRQHESFNHADTLFTFPVAKRGSGKPTLSEDWLSEFREFITESPFMDFDKWLTALDSPTSQPQIFVEEGSELIRKLNYKARSSEYKAVLLWLPERLHPSTANKLLKLIEEPYSDTIFVLTSDKPSEILPTIYSRTQRIFVRRYADEDVESFLVHTGVDPAVAGELARMAEGSLTEALKLSSSADDGMQMLAIFADLMRKGFKRDLPALRKWANDMSTKGRERQVRFVDYCARLMRENLMLHTSAGKYVTTMTPEEAKFSVRFHPFVNERNVIALFDAMNDARRDILANGNSKMVFFDLAIKILMQIRK
ncbi:MAG: DNA polymerase III subunit delta [Muribaculaceae bacterium]|nr:DNA polymerase III subunit delta [Muribaculaceae bacterium]